MIGRRRTTAAPEPPAGRTEPGTDDALRSAPVVEFRGVARTYPGPPPVPALRPSDLAVRRGDFVTVVGPSGSGKSTFLNIVGLLDRPTAGTYLLDGIDTSALSEADRTAHRGRRIGFVFQSFHLLPQRSAVDNVALPLMYTRTDRRVRTSLAASMLDRVGLGNRADALTSRLSGGERQRVAIARALVNQPSLLLCDEPTGNLDSDNAASVLQLIDELHRDGLTIVLVTHDPGVAALGDWSIEIRDGVCSVRRTAVDPTALASAVSQPATAAEPG